MDFERLASSLLARASTVVPEWFPQGKKSGHEWTVGSLAGEAGKSLSINLTTGLWADFATGAKGGDLVSLYAAIHGLEQAEAYRALEAHQAPAAPRSPSPPVYRPVKPNGHAGGFTGTHPNHGEPYALHAYRDEAGAVLFYVARYHLSGDKTFSPWTYDGTRWRPKAWPAPRPLYGLELLAHHPTSTVLVVEGELKCDLARRVLNPARQAIVVSWCGGAQAYRHTDWRPLSQRRVILWPDADEPGRAAAAGISELLSGCDLRAIDTTDHSEGWDIADLIASGATSASLQAFVRERAHPIGEPARPPQQLTELVAPSSAGPQPIAPSESAVSAKLPVFASQGQCWDYFGLAMGTGGRPWANVDNIDRIFSLNPETGGKFWYDEFRGRTMFGKQEWDENEHAGDLLLKLQRDFHMSRIATLTVNEAARGAARRNTKHPPRDWLLKLPKWDGVERLSRMLTEAFGTPFDEYYAAVGRNFLIGAVARIFSPGCQVDHMPVFESPQGFRKQNALRTLFDPWYRTVHTGDMNSKDFFMELRGAWCIELAEMDQVNRSTIERVKSVLTTRIDEYRPPYGREVKSFPRTSIFAGTTNSNQWNADETGARRFWPIAHHPINLEWLKENRKHLFSEALQRFQAAETWWLVPDDRAKEEQESRFASDPWEAAVDSWLALKEKTTIDRVLEALRVPIERQDPSAARRVGRILRHLGWVPKTERWMPASKPEKIFRPARNDIRP